MVCSVCKKRIKAAVECVSRKPVCRDCWDFELRGQYQQEEIMRCQECEHLSYFEDFREVTNGTLKQTHGITEFKFQGTRIMCKFCADGK